MHHIHIDRFAGLQSPVHALDPRAKLAATLACVLIVVLTPDGRFASFGVYALLVWAVLALSGVSMGYALKRSLAVLPFAVTVSAFVPFTTPGTVIGGFHLGGLDAHVTAEGLARFASLSLKALISFFATITLAATTPFGDLMKAARSLGLPEKMTVLISFMYRSLFLVIDEASHMMLARDLRGGGGLLLRRASGGIVGALLVRSMSHAETLARAMSLRGWTGRPVSLREDRLTLRDAAYAGGFVLLVIGGFILGGIVHG